MFPTLIADDESPDFPPRTEAYLLVGGPKHGEYAEVISSDHIYRTFGRPASPGPISASVYEPHTYVRRSLGMQTPDGDYSRDVFVHESIQSPQEAQAALANALVNEFVRGGRKVIDNGVSRPTEHPGR